MAYDIIGDIHGHADKLEALLARIGYSRRQGVWRHPQRQAIFVGDFIDRGPKQLDSVDIARRMVDGGSALAVMGNHEFNAIGWHTPNPRNPGEFLRPHVSGKWGDKNRKQHAHFLGEVGDNAALHKELVDWFLTLPLWLELPGLRVVHACWHQSFMDDLSKHLHLGRYLTRDLMMAATDEPADKAEKDNGNFSVFKAVEAITKGLEIPLPEGITFEDKDHNLRDRVRVRWWDRDATDFRSAARLPEDQRKNFPADEIPAHARIPLDESKPVFFGHYWMTGAPELQSPSAVCVDYSVGKGGNLVAYRWDGEPKPDPANFVLA